MRCLGSNLLQEWRVHDDIFPTPHQPPNLAVVATVSVHFPTVLRPQRQTLGGVFQCWVETSAHCWDVWALIRSRNGECMMISFKRRISHPIWRLWRRFPSIFRPFCARSGKRYKGAFSNVGSKHKLIHLARLLHVISLPAVHASNPPHPIPAHPRPTQRWITSF